jgi:7,8-dihydropterin-6-yl-methyl-4-(beta-D-ribofuranosyl)aminobenzene 5'-phosphate synthase
MRVKILYNNESEDGFISGWGFSCLIETGKRNILFDTGWDGNVLQYNMEKLGVAKEEIDAIVVSHDHWDHMGGLTCILHPEVEVYIPHSFSRRLKNEISQRAKVIEITKPKQITSDIYTTGELGGDIKEQALLLQINKGFVAVTGCAHPGLENVIDVARDFGKPCGVIGGFHNFSNFECLNDIELIVPCHCTRFKDELEKNFPDQYMDCKTGHIIEV